MNEKGNNIVVIFISLIVAILLGYVVMYIKTPTVKEEPEENKVVEDITIDELVFSNYLYDVDGNDTNETSAKIANSKVYLTINGNEYILNGFGNPVSVRIEHVVKEEEYNMIYVLSTNKLYYLSDVEYEGAINAKKQAIFNEVNIDNPAAIATVNEYDLETNYRYPTLYIKDTDGKIFVSKFGKDFEEYNKK